MKHRPDTTRVSCPQARRGFVANLLDALHASRCREAAREIDKYRYLIDEPKAAEMRRAIARSHAKQARLEARAGRGNPGAVRESQPTDAWTQTARVFVSQ